VVKRNLSLDASRVPGLIGRRHPPFRAAVVPVAGQSAEFDSFGHTRDGSVEAKPSHGFPAPRLKPLPSLFRHKHIANRLRPDAGIKVPN
jgi:hypothetical protein